MSSHSHLLDVKKWLNAQHVMVPVEWVEACVDFLHQEFRDSNMPLQQLKNHVYQQWLVADLEEIGVASLPPDLCTVQKVTLTGFFALQVNGIRDIGRPAYSQLRQLEGTMNPDAEVSAAPKAALPEWESKPTCMLLFNLTDGVNFVQGMEYKPITTLSPNLPPGLKILIKGPVDCRYGMILLTQDNIKILGGEVENHIQKYSREEMLREALQLHSEDETQQSATENQSSNSNYINSNLSSARAVQNNPVPPRRTQVKNRESPASFPLARPRDAHFSSTSVNNEIDLDNFECDDDDFAEDIDYDALDEIEKISSQQIPSQNTHPDSSVNEDEEMLQDAYGFQDNAGIFKKPDYVENPKIQHQNPVVPPTNHNATNSKDPFTYLSSVMVNFNENEEKTVTIKGFISKVLSRLQCTSGREWQLMAKVNDGTASIEADFHDKVLEELVGISAKDMIQMQVQARENAEIKNKIMEAISNCKKKLQELNCLMEIHFVPGQKPCVVKCTQVDKSHVKQLLNRVRR